MLRAAAMQIGGEDEMKWANDFIAEDYLSAFERSREFLSKVFLKMDSSDRIKYLIESWEENFKKGYVTEMETTAILTLSKDWNVSREFLDQVKS